MSRIIAEIDIQISKLQQARTLLQDTATDVASAPKSQRGRPKKAVASAAAKTPSNGRKQRNLSPDARKRIADAQKRRWAERRKQGA